LALQKRERDLLDVSLLEIKNDNGAQCDKNVADEENVGHSKEDRQE